VYNPKYKKTAYGKGKAGHKDHATNRNYWRPIMIMHRVHPTPELFETTEWEIITPEASGEVSPLSLRWLILASLVTVLLLSLAILL